MRAPLIAGNWKMFTDRRSAAALASGVARGTATRAGRADVAVCPPYPYLLTVGEVLRDTKVALGAQDAHEEDEGPFTGAVSARMLADAGCRYVVLGHSERRQHFGETDAGVRRKVGAALSHGLVPIVCVGETGEERAAGATEGVLRRQVREGLRGVAVRAQQVELAYEPVWAIGTGRTATPALASEAHGVIRAALAETVGDAAGGVRILYGGSVNPANARDLLSAEGVGGALVGGASLEAESFLAIVEAVPVD